MLTAHLDTLTTVLTTTLFSLPKRVFHKKIPPHDAVVLLEFN